LICLKALRLSKNVRRRTRRRTRDGGFENVEKRRRIQTANGDAIRERLGGKKARFSDSFAKFRVFSVDASSKKRVGAV
jgi:hypothetical protein